jgi:hypothetical protein
MNIDLDPQNLCSHHGKTNVESIWTKVQFQAGSLTGSQSLHPWSPSYSALVTPPGLRAAASSSLDLPDLWPVPSLAARSSRTLWSERAKNRLQGRANVSSPRGQGHSERKQFASIRWDDSGCGSMLYTRIILSVSGLTKSDIPPLTMGLPKLRTSKLTMHLIGPTN